MKWFVLLSALCTLVAAGNDDKSYKRWKSFMYEKSGESLESVERTNKLRDLIRNGIDEWQSFKGVHGKSFSNEDEENERMLTFLMAQEHVRVHNEAYQRGEKTFSLGINHLADLPWSEYRKLNGFMHMYGDGLRKNSSHWLAPMNVEIPDAVDWRDHGLVTDVKNQGMCGSCYAFSATGALEGQHKRKTKQMVSLSEQNIIDCSVQYGNNGCNGGLMDFVYEYVKRNHGLDTEESYPYKGHQHKCHFKKDSVGTEETGYVDLPEGDEEALKTAVATQGPISVAIDAGHRSFQLYKNGVYFEKNCNSKALDHGVLVVGYGTHKDHGDYWIVKNSWGTEWGSLGGYILMARNRNNNCGIASKASYPLV